MLQYPYQEKIGGLFMKQLFIIFLAIGIVIGLILYTFLLAITSDDLEQDIEIEKEIWDNYEKHKQFPF